MIRRIGLVLLSALALVVLLIAVAFGLMQTGFGKRMVVAQLEALLTTAETTIEISGLQGFVPFNMRLGSLAMADAGGAWLAIDDVRLAWSPSALLTGRLRVDQLSAARIALERLPPGGEPSTEPFRLPELPTWLPPTTLDKLGVARLDIGREVLGEQMSFALNGHLATAQNGQSIVLRLAADRVDQATASLNVDATIGLVPATLDLAVSATETGGLVAALSGDPAAGNLTLNLAGEGPLDDWRGDLAAEVEGVGRASGALGVALGDIPRLSLDGAVEPMPGLLPRDVATIVGERLSFTATVAQTGAQRLNIEALRVEAATAELVGDARLDLDSEAFDATVSLRVAELDPLTGLVGETLAGALQLDVTAEGTFAQPRGSARLQGDVLVFGAITAQRLTTDIAFDAREPLTESLRGLQLSTSGQLEGLSVPETQPLPLDDVSWQADVRVRSDDAIDVELARVAMADIALEARGEVDPKTLAAAGRIDLTIESLARLAAPFDQAVGGSLRLGADLVVAEQGQQIDARVDGAIGGLSGLPPGAAELLGSAVELTGTVLLRPDSLVQVEDLAVEGTAVCLRGDLDLTLPDQGLEGALTLELAQLEMLSSLIGQTMDGALEIDLTLDGSVPAPEVQLAARGRDFTLANLAIEQLALFADARGLPHEPAGKVELALSLEGVDVTLATPYRVQDHTLSLSELVLTAPRSRIDGALTVDLEQTLIDGTLEGEVQDLVGLAVLLPMPMRGAAEVAATLRPDGSTQSAEIALTVRDLIGGLQLDANATVTDALGEATLDARASVQDFHQDALHVDSARLDASGGRDALKLSAAVSGVRTLPFELNASAEVAFGEVLRVRLDQLGGEVLSQPLRLAQPAEATIGSQEFRLSGFDLRLADARLSADASLVGGQVAIDATLQDLTLAALSDLGVPDLLGEVDARLQMQGTAGDPRATFELTGTDLRAANPAFDDLPPAQLTASAVLAARRLRLDVRGEGVTAEPLTLTAELPLVLQLQPVAFAMPDGPISGRLDAESKLARLADIAGLDDDRLEGLLSIALTLTGRVADPLLDGTVEVSDGIYENGATGTVLHDMTLRATARQQRLTIDKLSANDGGSGSVTGEGFVEIDPAGSFPLDVTVSLRSARLVQTDQADAIFGGEVRLAGTAVASRLTGELTVERADISIPDQIGPNVASIEVEEIGGPAIPRQIGGGGSSFELRLDVVVDVPGRVFVRGRGLESEWQGRIEAKGPASAPRLTGSLSIRRGYFDLVDRRFNLRRGLISFNGRSPPNPTIDIEAVAEAADITAIIRIEGDASKPTLSLSSTPSLPDDEILSRVLFDRSSSQITPVQAIQLAAAVERLRGGAVDVFGTLRAAIGVDTLDVRSSEEGATDSRLRAGKYLADDIYVEAERGAASQSGRTRVEVEIMPRLSFEADAGEDSNAGVGLKWRFDY